MLTAGIIPEAANEGKVFRPFVFRPFYRCASLSDIPMGVKMFRGACKRGKFAGQRGYNHRIRRVRSVLERTASVIRLLAPSHYQQPRGYLFINISLSPANFYSADDETKYMD